MREKLLSKLMLLLAFMLVGAGNALADSWVKTAASDLQTGDVVAIVDETSGCAMSNDKGTSAPPAAMAVTISDGKIASLADNLKWEVTVSDKGYQFNVPDTEKYLYCTNSNNGVRVGVNENNIFTLSEAAGENEVPFLVNSGTRRYVGVYNNQDWRCYTSVINNIKYCVTAFYKLTSGGETPTPVVETVKTPSFNPVAGEVEEGTVVTIASETEGATIYYTTDGTAPTTASTKGNTVTVTEDVTIKAIAVKEGMNNSAVATAAYTVKTEVQPVEGYSIDFESPLEAYVNWTFTNIGTSNTAITAHGGEKYGANINEKGNGVASASIQTKDKVATPNLLTFYISKASTNTTSSSWSVAVSSDGTDWNVVGKENAGEGVIKDEWNEVSVDLSAYNDVFVRILYDGSNAIRTIDDISLSTDASAVVVAKPVFSVEGGKYTESQSVEISCITAGAKIYYTTDGSDPDNTSQEYTGAITVDETTTIKAIAYKDNVASAIASATYTIAKVQLMTIAEVRAQATGAVSTKGIVTSCVGKTAYIQDATAAICVYGKELTVGDEITVSGALTTYNGLLEITSPEVSVLSSGNTVEPTVKTIAEINADYAGNNALQGLFVKIEEATVTAISGNNTTIAQGENSIVVFKASGEFAVDDVITLEGNIGCYNAAQIVNPQNITVKQGETPAQTVATPTFNPEAGEVEAGKEIVISCATEGATIYYTLDESDPTAESTKYTAPITVNERTVIKAIAVKEGMTNSEVATAEYTIKEEVGPGDEGDTKTDVLNREFTGITGTTYTEWSGKTSNSDAVYAGQSAGGNESIQLRSNNNNSGVVTTTSGGKVKKIIVTWNSNTADGRTLNVYGSNTAYTAATDLYDEEKQGTLLGTIVNGTSTELVVTGDYEYVGLRSASGAMYLDKVEIVWAIPEGGETTNDPFINAEDVELEYDATTGEIAFTIDNPVTGTVLTASATADWITRVAVNGDKVIFATTANEGDADRTATITLVYGEVTKDVTVTQKHYVVDYATLPFVWEGGAKDVFLTVNGVTANGLGSDYAESHAPYRMKFDTTGDYIQVKTNAQPGRVTIGVKMIGGANESKITVQGSADGEEFTDVQELTISGSQNSVLTLATTKFFAEDCRYVRLVFTKGSNVGIGAISIDEPISYVEATVGEAGYATFCSSWALELPENVTAYIVSAVSESDVTLTEVTAIPANTPVILKAEANSYELPIIEDADAVEGNMLLASDGTVQGDGVSIFALGNKGEVGFYLVANGVTVPAGKAYLVLTAAVRDFLAFANGEADGINAVDNGQFAVCNVVYDLSGRRVEKAVKGIYIVNGKKVVK